MVNAEGLLTNVPGEGPVSGTKRQTSGSTRSSLILVYTLFLHDHIHLCQQAQDERQRVRLLRGRRSQSRSASNRGQESEKVHRKGSFRGSGCIRYGKAVYERTENEALKKYWHDTIGNVEKQAESLKNLPESAEIDFSKLPDEEDFYHIEGLVYFTLKQMIDLQSESKTVDEFANNNKIIQRELDRLSIALMPASAQAVIDHIITTLATPLPEDIAKTAKALNDRVMKFGPSPRFVDATEYLQRIEDESEWAQFSTGRMEARWANDFVNGAYEKRAAEMYEAKKAGKPEGYNTEGGRSYAVSTAALATSRFRRYIGADLFVKRIVQSLKIITWNWEAVTAMLPDTSELLKLRAAYYSVGSLLG